MKWRSCSAANTWDNWRTLLDSSNTSAASSNAITVTCGTDATLATINGVTVKINVTKPTYTYSDVGAAPSSTVSCTTENVKTALGTGTSTTTFLNNKGEWGTPAGTYSLPTATYNTLGGVKPAYTTTGAATGFTAATNTSTPSLSARTTTSNRYYAVEADTNGILFVNVPWENDNTDTLVNYTLDTTTRAYLMGSQNAPTSTTTARASHGDIGVYLTNTAGHLSAKAFSLNDGAASASSIEKAYTIYNSTDDSIDFVFV